MSYFHFGNVAASVPPVLDTTPCMQQMIDYEDCVYQAKIPYEQIFHPNWPSVFPSLLTDGRLISTVKQIEKLGNLPLILNVKPLDMKQKQLLYECEQQRFTFKACLRKLLTLERTVKHTSWDTAEVANMQLT